MSTATRPARVQAGGEQREPGGGPGDHAGRPGEGAQRQQLAVHDGGQHQRGDLGAAGDQAGQGVEPGRDHRVGHRPAQLGFAATTSRAASTCSRASAWRGAFGQRSLSPGSAPATRSAPWSDGVGDGAGPDRLALVGRPSRAALATAERRLTSAATWPPWRRSARWRSAWSTRSRAALDGGGDVGEREQRGERIGGHPVTLATRPARPGHPPATRPGPPAAPSPSPARRRGGIPAGRTAPLRRTESITDRHHACGAPPGACRGPLSAPAVAGLSRARGAATNL